MTSNIRQSTEHCSRSGEKITKTFPSMVQLRSNYYVKHMGAILIQLNPLGLHSPCPIHVYDQGSLPAHHPLGFSSTLLPELLGFLSLQKRTSSYLMAAYGTLARIGVADMGNGSFRSEP